MKVSLEFSSVEEIDDFANLFIDGHAEQHSAILNKLERLEKYIMAFKEDAIALSQAQKEAVMALDARVDLVAATLQAKIDELIAQGKDSIVLTQAEGVEILAALKGNVDLTAAVEAGPNSGSAEPPPVVPG